MRVTFRANRSPDFAHLHAMVPSRIALLFHKKSYVHRSFNQLMIIWFNLAEFYRHWMINLKRNYAIQVMLMNMIWSYCMQRTESAGSLLPAERAFLRMLRRMLDPSQRNQRRPEAAPAVDRALEKTLERMAGQLESMVNATWQAFEERRKEAEATDTIQEDVAALLDCCKVNDLGVRGLVKSLEALTSKVANWYLDQI